MDSLNSLIREGIWALLLLVISSAALYVALARNKSAALGAAIGRNSLTFFTGPFGYLRKTISDLALGKANPRLKDTDYYLLNRFITSVQVTLVVVVVLGGGLVLTSAVFSMLPAPDVRESLTTAQDQLKQAETTGNQTESTVKQQDQDWQSRRSELMKNAENESHQKVKVAQDALAADESALQANPETGRVLESLKTFFQSHEGDPSASEQAKTFVQRLPSLNEAQVTDLSAYCDHWAALQSVPSAEPGNADVIRTRLQPDHTSLVEQLQGQKEEVAQLQANADALDKEVGAAYKPLNLVVTVVAGALFILGWIWTVGLVLEIFSIGFFLANDVKQIRADVEKRDAKGMAAASGSAG